MPSLVIKKLPEQVHKKLKQQAAKHHRSMTQEAILILNDGLNLGEIREVPAPYKGKIPLSDEMIDFAKLEGRK